MQFFGKRHVRYGLYFIRRKNEKMCYGCILDGTYLIPICCCFRMLAYLFHKTLPLLFKSVTVPAHQLEMLKEASKKDLPIIYLPLHRYWISVEKHELYYIF